MTVGIIDYGAGNMFSIQSGLQHAGLETNVISEPSDLQFVDAVVIPGVGNFSQASKALDGFRIQLREFIDEGRIVLGVCLGMQILLEASEEGSGVGLDLIEGAVKLLPSHVKVPHMGWNTIAIKKDCPLLDGIDGTSYFYFVHSYYASPTQNASVVATTDYGISFPSVVANGSLYGVQFHPEKSGAVGASVLSNFRTMVRR